MDTIFFKFLHIFMVFFFLRRDNPTLVWQF